MIISLKITQMLKMRSRAWTWTLNNYTDDEIEVIKNVDCKYICFGEEVGEEGTPHLQGFVYFPNAKTLAAVKKIIGNRIHLEKSRGDIESNFKYCSKDGIFWEKGDKPAQGKRTDIDKVKELVKKKAPMKDIIMEVNSFQAVRFAETASYYLSEDRTEKPVVIWLFGLAGVGKTKWVFNNFKDVYVKDGTMWWNNYTQNQCICIDDFDGKWPFRDLLRLLDRYPYQGQVKGGYVKINSPYIVITCEFPIYEFWDGNEYQQVKRRVDIEREVCTSAHTEVGGNTKSPTLDELLTF